MKPLITVAIAVFNCENYIAETLLSALNQTYDNIEVIVVDDCGTDNSMSVVENIKVSHSRGNIIRVIKHDENLHTGAARNTGIDNALGKYIYFLDSDDKMAPDCLTIMQNIITKENVDVVLSSHAGYYGSISDTPAYITHVPNSIIRSTTAILNGTNSGQIKYVVPLWNKLFDLDFLKRNNIRCIPHHLQEDPWFSFQVQLKANSVASVDVVTYHHLFREGNQSLVPLGAFHMKQNIEICNSEISLMKEFQVLPIGAIELYLSRLRYLIPYIPNCDYTKKEVDEQILCFTNLLGINYSLSKTKKIGDRLLLIAYKTRNAFFIRKAHSFVDRFRL